MNHNVQRLGNLISVRLSELQTSIWFHSIGLGWTVLHLRVVSFAGEYSYSSPPPSKGDLAAFAGVTLICSRKDMPVPRQRSAGDKQPGRIV